MDRVADFESVGWGFESLVPRQNTENPLVGFFGFLMISRTRTQRSASPLSSACGYAVRFALRIAYCSPGKKAKGLSVI